MPACQTFLTENRSVIAVAGEDARTFLQGLISNDINKAAPNRAIHAAFLTPQGRYLHDFFIAELNGVFLLDVEAGRAADLKKRLSMYKLRSKVTVEMADDRWRVALVWGEGTAAALGLDAEEGAAAPFAGGVAFIDPRLAAGGARAILPADQAASALAPIGTAGPLADWDRNRITLGLPDGSRDQVIEKDLLLECGYDELHGVDFQKGCYLGQELTARTKYRGLVKKRLIPVTVSGALPAPGTPIEFDGAEAGDLRSGVDGVALAFLRLEQMDKALQSGQPLTAGEAKLTPQKPAWVSV